VIFTESLKKNRDFLYLYKKGKFLAARIMVVHCKPNNSKINRLGVSVSKKAGNSVRRNRVRRIIKENYRLMEGNIVPGYNIIIVYRNIKEIPEFTAFKKEMKYIFNKLGLLK
jgi:ribonuclease P protein component